MCHHCIWSQSSIDQELLLYPFRQALVHDYLDVNAAVEGASLKISVRGGGVSCAIASRHDKAPHWHIPSFAQLLRHRGCAFLA